jgi:hypothetical protein
MKRTSLTHPLQIAIVSAGPDFGRVGITFCPGKYDRHAMTGEWVRDLALDLDRVRDWGAAAVVSLLELEELVLLRVERLGDGGICCGSIFQLLTCRFRTNDSRGSGNWPVKNCARSYGAGSTSWSIAAEGLGVLAR